MTDDLRDVDTSTAGVMAPAPLVFAAAFALGVALGRGNGAEGDATGGARALGAAAVAAGVATFASAIGELRRNATPLNPYQPSSSLVTSGVYRFSRNPVYVAFTSIYIGAALAVRSTPALVLLPVALAVLDRGVVDPEERYLERRFGASYRSYRHRVPRWF